MFQLKLHEFQFIQQSDPLGTITLKCPCISHEAFRVFEKFRLGGIHSSGWWDGRLLLFPLLRYKIGGDPLLFAGHARLLWRDN
jgi:hypothetical protein